VPKGFPALSPPGSVIFTNCHPYQDAPQPSAGSPPADARKYCLINQQPCLLELRQRSGNGFVTSLLVPEGNAADSIKRTGVVAELVSTDDGYASAKGRDELHGLGVGRWMLGVQTLCHRPD